MNRCEHSRKQAHDEAAIRALEAAYDAAWNDRAIEALVACFAEEAVIVNPYGEIAKGRVEIGRILAEVLNGPAEGSRHTSTLYRVEFVTEDVAVVDGGAVIDRVIEGGGTTASALTHRFTDVVVRKSSAWEIAHVRAYALLDVH